MIVKGTVKLWNERGYGFLRPDQPGPDVFAHVSNLADDLEELKPGQRVQYVERISSRNGKPEAIAVELIAEDEPPARATLAVAFGDR